MSQTQTILLVFVVAVVVLGLLYVLRARHSQRLRNRFGPEYTRSVRESGSTRRGEARLSHLEKRVEHFHIHALSPAEGARFGESWRQVQSRFVDEPNRSLAEADRLIAEVMTARGYPVTDFEQQAADLSVNHPLVVENYRAGHGLAVRPSQGQTSTEDLRQAMIHYRKLFEDLVGESEFVPVHQPVDELQR